MISIYTGMDMNFTQPFTTAPHGLSKNRFPTFNPQDTFHQPQQSQPQQSTFTLMNDQGMNSNMSVSTVVPLVEPMIQSHLPSSSSSSSLSLPISSSPSSTYQQQQNNNMYYHPYPSSTYVPDSANTSVTSSPSMDDSWKYTSTELFPETSLLSSSSSSSTSTSNSPSSHPHYIATTSAPSSSSSSAFLYSHQQQDDYYAPSYSSCSTSPSISHSPSLNIYDPLPSFQISTATSPSFISYQHSPPICSGKIRFFKKKFHVSILYTHFILLLFIIVPSPPQSTMTIIPTSISTSSLSSSTASINHPHHHNTQSQHKKKHTSSSPLIYSKHSRTSSSSSSSTSSTSQHHHHHPYSQKSNTSSSPASSEYHHGGSSSSFSSFISRKMTSSFPTKHDATSGTSKRYECHICSKKFTRPSSLTTHIYSHTGEVKDFFFFFWRIGKTWEIIINELIFNFLCIASLYLETF